MRFPSDKTLVVVFFIVLIINLFVSCSIRTWWSTIIFYLFLFGSLHTLTYVRKQRIRESLPNGSECPHCSGRGWYPDGYADLAMDCYLCNGEGTINKG